MACLYFIIFLRSFKIFYFFSWVLWCDSFQWIQCLNNHSLLQWNLLLFQASKNILGTHCIFVRRIDVMNAIPNLLYLVLLVLLCPCHNHAKNKINMNLILLFQRVFGFQSTFSINACKLMLDFVHGSILWIGSAPFLASMYLPNTYCSVSELT